MRARIALVLLAVVALAGGCKRRKPVAPEDAFGCVNTFDGKEMSCTELDASVDAELRTKAAAACPLGQIKQVGGHPVAHCPDDGVAATCSLPAERATIRYYQRDLSAEGLRGSELGCKMRGGTFAPR